MSTLKESVHLEGGTRRTAKFRTTCGRRKVTAIATLTVRASTATSRLTAMVQASLHGRTKTNFPPQETWAGGKCWTPGITPRKQLKRPKKHPIARTSTVLQTQPPAKATHQDPKTTDDKSFPPVDAHQLQVLGAPSSTQHPTARGCAALPFGYAPAHTPFSLKTPDFSLFTVRDCY